MTQVFQKSSALGIEWTPPDALVIMTMIMPSAQPAEKREKEKQKCVKAPSKMLDTKQNQRET